MTIKVFSVRTKRMKEVLALDSDDVVDLDAAMKKNGYLRLDVGYNPGNQIHYIKQPEGWTDGMMIEALPKLALARMAITIACTMGELTNHAASQITDRFKDGNEAATALPEIQISFSLENSSKDYAQPVRESYNFKEEDLGRFAAWSMRIAPKITHQMLRRAADISGISPDVITSYLPNDVTVGDDLAPDVMESWDKGLKATTAELYHWLRLNPAVKNPRYTRFTTMLGLDSHKAWQEVDDWLQSTTRT